MKDKFSSGFGNNMRRRRQRSIDLPPGWFDRLESLVHELGWSTLDDFCEDPADRENGLKISVKTLERVVANKDRMTMAKFDVLRRKLDEKTREDLLEKLSASDGSGAVESVAGSAVSVRRKPMKAIPPDESTLTPPGVTGLAFGQAAPGSLTDRIFTTQQDLPQWADPWELDLGNGWLESVACTIETDADYFRFGFKLLGERGRLFGDGSIQSQDTNLLIHIGRNNWDRANPPISVHDIFLTWFKNGVKRGKDVRLFEADPHVVASISLVIDTSHVARFLLNGECCLQTVIPPEIRRRVVMLVWGDSEECTVRVRDIIVHTCPDL
jgi:hypothetical protein